MIPLHYHFFLEWLNQKIKFERLTIFTQTIEKVHSEFCLFVCLAGGAPTDEGSGVCLGLYWGTGAVPCWGPGSKVPGNTMDLWFLAEPASRAPLLSKFGNLSIRKILVMTSAYACTDSGGGGGKSQGNPTGGGECHLFLAGNRAVLLGNRVFLGAKSHDRRFWKRGF